MTAGATKKDSAYEEVKAADVAERKAMKLQPEQATPAGFAELMTRSDFGAAVAVLKAYETQAGNVASVLQLTEFTQAIRDKAAAVSKGDISHAEQMIVAQSIALDHLFSVLAQRSLANMGAGHLDATDTYMRLALRCQSQSRANWETLAAMKNPPLVITRQANVAQQQVNHFARGELESKPNELLEHTDGQRLDAGAASATKRGNSSLAALVPVDRTKNGGGKEARGAKRSKGRDSSRGASRAARSSPRRVTD